MRAAKVQASLRIRAVSPEPSLLAHTSSEKRGTFRRKARSLAPLNGWACAVRICHDGMLEDTNSLDGAQISLQGLTSSIRVSVSSQILQSDKLINNSFKTFILLYKGLKGKASIPTDDLIAKTRRCTNQHSMAFQTPIANTDVYKGSFFPQTISD